MKDISGDLAIQIEGLSKQYYIGGPQKVYDRFGDQIVDTIFAPFRRTIKLLRGQSTGASELDESIWALNNVSFEVKPGEVVGVIGRNGAGKSTLLKILSRIAEPTSGYVNLYGRVGALLEVGTGFHPELTGRENIFLNGAILGMKRVEIIERFEEIVEFAEIGKFIDTPVKHYSSGMYVRLAFSVAAHLEPEILLVDEVLAVGDVAFQQKCLGKMDNVGQLGRTVLFVSHNMGLLQSLCQRGILLHEGSVVADGPITDVVDIYLKTLEDSKSEDLSKRTDRRGVGHSRLVGLEVYNGNGDVTTTLRSGQSVRFVFQIDKSTPTMDCNCFIYDHLGQPAAAFMSKIPGPLDKTSSDKDLQFELDIKEIMLLPGRYRVDVVILGDKRMQDSVQAAVFIDIAEGHIGGRPAQADKRFSVTMPHQWTVPSKKT